MTEKQLIPAPASTKDRSILLALTFIAPQFYSAISVPVAEASLGHIMAALSWFLVCGFCNVCLLVMYEYNSNSNLLSFVTYLLNKEKDVPDD